MIVVKITGPQGEGKSKLAAAIKREFCQRHKNCYVCEDGEKMPPDTSVISQVLDCIIEVTNA